MPSQSSGPTVGLDLSVTEAEAELPGEHIPRLIVVVMNVKRRDPMLADVRLPLDDDEVISRRAKNVSRELLDVHCSALSRRQAARPIGRANPSQRNFAQGTFPHTGAAETLRARERLDRLAPRGRPLIRDGGDRQLSPRQPGLRRPECARAPSRAA
jgi:hypothetical protein